MTPKVIALKTASPTTFSEKRSAFPGDRRRTSRTMPIDAVRVANMKSSDVLWLRRFYILVGRWAAQFGFL